MDRDFIYEKNSRRDIEAVQERLERMEREAGRQLLTFGDKKWGQIAKEAVKRAAGRYVPSRDRIFWPAGLLARGLFSAMTRPGQSPEGRERILAELQIFFERWIEEKMPVYCVDDALCGTVLLRLYQETEEEKYRLGADRLADYLTGLAWEAADAKGSIPYRPAQGTGHIYADSMGMICPFLSAYGKMFRQPEMMDLAAVQLKNMLACGMEAGSGLPYHGYHLETGMKYGIVGWGRAVGWLMLGLSGTLQWMEPTHPDYLLLTAAWEKLVTAAAPWQKENGAFPWQLQAQEGPEDSSATAMIAAALSGFLFRKDCAQKAEGEGRFTGSSVCFGSGKDCVQEAEGSRTVPGSVSLSPDIRHLILKILEGAAVWLEGCEQNGQIRQASGECEGFAQYPQVYGCYPWSLGPALEFLCLRASFGDRKLTESGQNQAESIRIVP